LRRIAQLKNEAGKKCSNVQYSNIENMNISKKGEEENGDGGRQTGVVTSWRKGGRSHES
jgi:hypothetical protein